MTPTPRTNSAPPPPHAALPEEHTAVPEEHTTSLEEHTAVPEEHLGNPDALRETIAGSLLAARERTRLLTESVDDDDLVRQHSPLMSPLVWDLAHIANQEELWLLREVGGRDSMHPEIDPLYDAFEHPRAERPTLPLLPPAEARAYGHEVRGRVLDLLERARFSGLAEGGIRLLSDGFAFGMVRCCQASKARRL